MEVETKFLRLFKPAALGDRKRLVSQSRSLLISRCARVSLWCLAVQMVTAAKGQNPFILTGMPTKLRTEIIAAAIAGFEEQKKRLNAQIAELRQILNPSAPDGGAPSPLRRRMSAAARARIAAAQRKRWAAARKESGAASAAPPRKKRRLSAAGRKAIIEATKRRWSAFRKTQSR